MALPGMRLGFSRASAVLRHIPRTHHRPLSNSTAGTSWRGLGGRPVKKGINASDISRFEPLQFQSFKHRTPLTSRYLSTGKDETTKEPTPASPVSKKRLKSLLPTPHENIYNLPNFLTFGRLVASPIIGYLVLHDYNAAAFSLFAVAGFTDLIDGYIARKWKLQTVVGSVIDPMADKTLMTILTVCLAVKGVLPVWLAGIILGRDIGLAISAIYWRWISLPPPKTMARYWDFSLPSAEVRPTTISKLNTALQLALIGVCTAHPLINAGADWEVALQAMQYTVATTTVWSGLSYVVSNDAVRIIKPPVEKMEQPLEGEDDKKDS